MIVLRIVLFVIAATLAAGTLPLRAQSLDDQASQSLDSIFSRTINNSLQSWVREITRFGGANGSVGSISTRLGDSALLVNGLLLEVPGLELRVGIGKAILESPRLRDSEFVAQADKITLYDVSIRQGQLEFATDLMVLDQTALPRLDIARLGATNGGTDIFERQRQFLTQLLSFQAEMISIPRLAVRTYSSKKETELLGESIYQQNVISDVKDRQIGTWEIADTLSLSPPLEPIVRESFKDAVFTGLNINAFTSLLDPALDWSTKGVILEGLTVRDYAVSIGGLTLSIDAMRLASLTLEALDETTRKNLITVAKSPNGIDAVPNAEVPQFLLSMASAFDVEELQLQRLSTEALGIDYFTIGSMGMSQASLGGFAEIDLQELRTSLTDLGALNISRATVKNADFPDKDILRAKLDGDAVSTAALIPTFTSVFLEGFEANVPDLALEAGIQSLDLKTKTNADGTPNGLAMTLEKLRIPTALIPEGKGLITRLTSTLRTMDTETLELNQSLSLQYDSSQQVLTLEELDIDIQDLGRLQVAARIEDVATSPFTSPAQASTSIRSGKLMGSQITFSNAGVVEAGFDAQAAKLNTKGDVLRGQVGATLPFLVAVLQNQRFQKELVTALQAFLPNPDSLIVELKPESGVAIADIERQLRGDPRKLLALLGITIQNRPDGPEESSEPLPN